MICCRARDDKARQRNPGFNLAIVMSGPVRTVPHRQNRPEGGRVAMSGGAAAAGTGTITNR